MLQLGSTPTDYGFTGQRWEASLGLMHYGARFYSPWLGRFVQADTVVPEPGNPQDLNRYAYVRNNPLRYTDPSGHWIFEETPNDPYFIPPSTLYSEAQRRQDFITPSAPQPPVRTIRTPAV
ncbi:MAG: RHS repeat-associated core domain-containing protein, partial [Anaerolineae bacterium]|nr:RHS repeat-associated core domain-containing protein [Anaerolineae bacterium]